MGKGPVWDHGSFDMGWRTAVQPSGWPAYTPPVDAFETDEGIVLQLDLPGVAAENVEVEVLDEAVTVKGLIRPFSDAEANQYFRAERPRGPFLRLIELPAPVETAHATSRMQEGVLTIRLRKRFPGVGSID